MALVPAVGRGPQDAFEEDASEFARARDAKLSGLPRKCVSALTKFSQVGRAHSKARPSNQRHHTLQSQAARLSAQRLNYALPSAQSSPTGGWSPCA